MMWEDMKLEENVIFECAGGFDDVLLYSKHEQRLKWISLIILVLLYWRKLNYLCIKLYMISLSTWRKR